MVEFFTTSFSVLYCLSTFEVDMLAQQEIDCRNEVCCFQYLNGLHQSFYAINASPKAGTFVTLQSSYAECISTSKHLVLIAEFPTYIHVTRLTE